MKKNITVKQKVNGWLEFIKYMINDCTTDIQHYVNDGLELGLIDSIIDKGDKIAILADFYGEVDVDYKTVDWRSYMRSLLYERDYVKEMLDYIDQTFSLIGGDDVINAMLNDAFGKEV